MNDAATSTEHIAAAMGDRNLSPKQFGALGERYAAVWLEKKGWTTLSHNWRTRYGELDLVMLNDEHTVVFVEVKSRHPVRLPAGGRDAGQATESQESCLRLAA